ncbi:MAG: YeeE/YedE family protein [Desulfuromonas sp.]|nr:YeeE/YedE family protein [Desulfuromonas sp.]
MDGYWLIIITGLVSGLIAGYVMYRSDYCLVGMLRDLFMFRSGTMARFLVVQIAASLILLELARAAGWLPYYPSLLMGPANLSSVIGGALFGFGMVLTGSCVIGCVYRTGAGNALGLCTLLAMIGGATLFGEIAPWWKDVTTELGVTTQVTIPQSLGISPAVVVFPLAAVLLLLIRRWFKGGQLILPATARGYIQPWKTAVIMAVITLGACVFTGMPLGITTSYVKIGAWLENWFIPQHVTTTAYFNIQALEYIPPFTSTVIRGGTMPHFDAIAALQLSVILGILVGAFFSAKRLGEFRWVFRVPLRQYGLVVVGGVLVGLAARMAPGCNVWHLFGGVPLLAWNSILFALGLLPGVWLGSKVLLARLA